MPASEVSDAALARESGLATVIASEIRGRMARGAIWAILLRLLDRALGLLSTLVLVRLLAPADFGLVAMATAFIAVLELLRTFSFDLALIQNAAAERKHYDTAWTLNVLLGTLTSFLVLASAKAVALFYQEPRVAGLLYLLALAQVVQGFENIGVVAFQRDLELHKDFWLGLGRRLIGSIATVAIAFAWRDYHALVIGIVVSRVAGVPLSYMVQGYRPRFSLAATSELMTFSSWLLLNNVLIFVNYRGVDLLIGRVCGPKALGTYDIAYEISNLPTTELVWPIHRALFPGYTLLARDLARLRQTFLDAMGVIAVVALPAGIGIGVVALPLVSVLLGERWLAAVDLIYVLAAFGVVRALHGPTGAVYLALGVPRRVAVVQLVQIGITFSLLTALLPAVGVQAAPISILAGAVVAATVNFTMLRRTVDVAISDLGKQMWRPLAASGMMIFTCRIVAGWLEGFGHRTDGVALVSLVVTGTLTYVATVAGLWWLARCPAGSETRLFRLVGLKLPSRTSVC